MSYSVTFQFPVQIADGSIWLYEKPAQLPIPPAPGILLAGLVPNVFGPNYQADNVIRQVVIRGAEVCCAVHGLRDPTLDRDEMDAKLGQLGWRRQPEPLRVSPLQKPENYDPIDDLFN
jgi:hypothetical protein